MDHFIHKHLAFFFLRIERVPSRLDWREGAFFACSFDPLTRLRLMSAPFGLLILDTPHRSRLIIMCHVDLNAKITERTLPFQTRANRKRHSNVVFIPTTRISKHSSQPQRSSIPHPPYVDSKKTPCKRGRLRLSVIDGRSSDLSKPLCRTPAIDWHGYKLCCLQHQHQVHCIVRAQKLFFQRMSISRDINL